MIFISYWISLRFVSILVLIASYVGRACALDSRELGAQVEGGDEGYLVCSCFIVAWRSESRPEDLLGLIKSC